MNAMNAEWLSSVPMSFKNVTGIDFTKITVDNIQKTRNWFIVSVKSPTCTYKNWIDMQHIDN